MPVRTTNRSTIGRQAAAMRRSIGAEVRRLRVDRGLSIRAVAATAGIHHSHLAHVEAGEREASLAALIAIADALGADLRVRLYPATGPRVHDRIQTVMVEALLSVLHPRWKRLVEVPVFRPARGFIDVVLAEPTQPTIVAVESQSEIHRFEQELRWAADKAASLPSAEARSMLTAGGERQPTISRLLLLRSTAATRDLARRVEQTFSAAYPARSLDAYRALTSGDLPWPGAAIVWAVVESGRARILERPPRGVSVGR